MTRPQRQSNYPIAPGDQRGPKWPQRWDEDEPPFDTAPEWSPEKADVLEWGRTTEESRRMLLDRMCPICGEGPWKSPLNHVSRRHGIDRLTMRDLCDLSLNDKVTEEASREAWAKNGRAKVSVLRKNSSRAKGRSPEKKARVTKASERSVRESGLLKWMDENPEAAAALRAGFRDRMNTPEARKRWRESMEAVWAKQSERWTQEEREAFKAQMSSPEVEEKRMAAREASRTVNCSVEGCGRPHVAKGLCNLHWNRVHRSGSVGSVDPMSPIEAGRLTGRKPALTPAQMDEARALCSGGMTQKQVAARYGVTQATISRVVRGVHR